jgi:hypothetical protein
VVRLPGSPAARGRALVSYLRSAAWSDDDPRLRGHSNQWESRQIARSLAGIGFEVDVVEFADRDWEPSERYDVVLAIDAELLRLEGDRRLLHLTGAFPPFQNAAELRRVEELRSRRGVECVPRRLVADPEPVVAALERADACSLIGNAWTLSTFPDELRPKMTPIPVSGSLPVRVKSARAVARSGRGFMWFFGSGAVHKGLDRTLEAFAAEPGLELHVVGNIGGEDDFVAAYRHELTELPNVHWHGFLDPGGRRFARVARECSFVIAPSCSEGTSPATVTALQVGLHPLIARETGVDLPAGLGYLERSGPEDIAAAAHAALALPAEELFAGIAAVQRHALATYSRRAFDRAMRAYLEAATGG